MTTIEKQHQDPEYPYAVIRQHSRYEFWIHIVGNRNQESSPWPLQVWTRWSRKSAERKARRELAKYRHHYVGLDERRVIR